VVVLVRVSKFHILLTTLHVIFNTIYPANILSRAKQPVYSTSQLPDTNKKNLQLKQLQKPKVPTDMFAAES